MNTRNDLDTVAGWSAQRQLELIQRVGRVGLWEYDPGPRAMSVPDSSLRLLASLIGREPPGAGASTFLATLLPDAERRRFRAALDEAVARGLPLAIELRLAGGGPDGAWVSVRGAPLDTERGPRFGGTFTDITREKRAETEREEVIRQLNALIGSLPLGVTVFDEDLRLLFWNDMIYDILGLPQGAVYKYVRFEELIRYPAERGEYGPGDPAELVRARAALARRFEAHRFERPARDGRTLLVEGFPFRFGGRISGFVTTYTDITERKRTEEQLLQQNNVLRTIIDNFPGAISLFDSDLRMAAHNEQFRTLLDLPEQLFAKDPLLFEDFIRYNALRGEYGPGDPEAQIAAIVARARNFQAHKLERVRPNGQALEVRGTPLPGGGFVSIYIDVTERKRAEERIRVMALTDTLTGLPNRLNLNEQIEQAVERAVRSGGKRFALLFLDLDGFKAVNDTLGHDAGDELLVEVARRLRDTVHATDIVARLGGDEFVILLHDVDGPGAAERIAAAILTRLAAPCALTAAEARVGGSIGIALYPEHGTHREALLKAADSAMYAAKAGGRGVWRIAGETGGRPPGVQTSASK